MVKAPLPSVLVSIAENRLTPSACRSRATVAGPAYRRLCPCTGQDGFTLIELLVVLAIVALLLSIAAPRYFNSISQAEESVLRENLHLIREALDRYYADKGRYPDTPEQLVEARYLRAVPMDPITQSANSWVLVPPSDPAQGGVYNVRSGAIGVGSDRTPYSEW